MADDIITELSQDRSLFVIARGSSFTYKGGSGDVRQIANELVCAMSSTAAFAGAGGRIRVNARLIDTTTGHHIWARRYDRAVEDVFAVQDEIASAVVRAILPAVATAERQRAMRKAPDSLSAWEAWQRALWHWSGGDLPNSRAFLERAVALDPRFAPPHAMLAWLYLSEATIGVGLPLQETLVPALTAAQTALELDPDSAIAHAMLAWVLDHQGNSRSALEEAETAIALNPNDPQGYLIKGHVLLHSGRPAEARESLTIALRLDPRGPIAAVVTAEADDVRLLSAGLCGGGDDRAPRASELARISSALSGVRRGTRPAWPCRGGARGTGHGNRGLAIILQASYQPLPTLLSRRGS